MSHCLRVPIKGSNNIVIIGENEMTSICIRFVFCFRITRYILTMGFEKMALCLIGVIAFFYFHGSLFNWYYTFLPLSWIFVYIKCIVKCNINRE